MADGFKQIDELQTVGSLNELNRQLSTLFDLVAGDGNTLRVYSGYGVPTLAANNGSIYLRIDGAVATTVYARVSGSWQSIPSGSSAGDVVGPASATDNAVARFDGTTGKLIQNSVVTVADSSGNMAGVGTVNTHTIPAGTDTFAMLAATQTLTNKRITPRVVSVSDATSITPNIDTSDVVSQSNTQAAGTLTINAHSGTPVDGQKFILRVNCTNAQTLSWNAVYIGSTDLPLPSGTTGSSRTDYFGFQYYSSSSKWHLLAKTQGF